MPDATRITRITATRNVVVVDVAPNGLVVIFVDTLSARNRQMNNSVGGCGSLVVVVVVVVVVE